jgi:hypothetical protein
MSTTGFSTGITAPTDLAGAEERAVDLLMALSEDERYPAAWIQANIMAVRTGNYDELAGPFSRMEFVGPDGDFAIAAPFTVVREAGRDQKFSDVVGRVIPHPDLPPLRSTIEELFGELREPIPHILPVEVTFSSGNLNAESGDAFIVSDGWPWPDNILGPPLNNMTEQRRRMATAFKAINRIFDEPTAELLIGPLRDEHDGILVQHLEYQMHDAGHVTGMGLRKKLSLTLLPDYWNQGIEEWRADGVDFELAVRSFSADVAAQVIASNWVVRFGIDAHRAGGIDADFDVGVTLLTLDRLFANGALAVRGKRLSLNDPTPRGLIRAVELHRTEAVTLTREEMELTKPSGLLRLHGSFNVHKATQEVFKGLVVEPCKGLFTELR